MRARSAVVCLASEGLVYCWVMLGRQVLWGQVALIQLQNQACTQLEPLTCWVFLCMFFMSLPCVAQGDGEAMCAHHAMHQMLRIKGKCQDCPQCWWYREAGSFLANRLGFSP